MNLSDFFKENNKAAIAFSGGVDSAYLLYAANQIGADITAYYVKSAFQPEFELADAKHLSMELNVPIKILSLDILNIKEITANPKRRCYYCKKQIFSAITKSATEDGYSLILDGTNASDDIEDRPGMKVLSELDVRSPLRECGLTKSEIRQLSKEAELFTWNKPAYACLATRIPFREKITAEKLYKIEMSENLLFSFGFRDFRVRTSNDMAKIQLRETDIHKLIDNRDDVLKALKRYYKTVVLDLEVRI